jgi:hypothetical protein
MRAALVNDPEWSRKWWVVARFWLAILMLLIPGILSHLVALHLLVWPAGLRPPRASPTQAGP